jgi:putative FmdB family regulatory protein
MPTYEYECAACGNTFELFQMISDPPKRKCPACGKLKAKRLIGSGGALIFKGSGFYKTDYRSDEYKRQAKQESGSTTSTAPESKPSASDKSSSAPAKKD